MAWSVDVNKGLEYRMEKGDQEYMLMGKEKLLCYHKKGLTDG